MNTAGPERLLAVVLSRLSGQARGRLVEGLPAPCREGVLGSLDEIDRLDRSEMTVVEQVLVLELERLFGDVTVAQDTFREYYSLRVADIITLVLLKGNAEHAASTLSHLPHTVQAECIHALAVQDWGALENHLGVDERDSIHALDTWLGDPIRGPRFGFALSILQDITAPRQLRALLTDIHHRDSEVAKTIQASLFSIEDLRRLSDREIQTLTTGIDDWDLAIALLGMSEGLRRRILSNVSERRAALLQEDATYLEDTDDDDVEAVCDRMLIRARMLYESGQLATYLGSVSAEPVNPDEEEDEAPREASKSTGEDVSETEPVRRSFRGMILAVSALLLVSSAWYLGVGRSGPGRHKRARATASDFGSRQRLASRGTADGGVYKKNDDGASDSQVSATDGEVFVVSGARRTEIEEAPISRGDIVETGKGSRALIDLNDGLSRLEVEEESAIQLGEEDQSAGPPKLSLRLGNVWVLAKNPSLEVHSPVASVTAAAGSLYRFRVVLSSATTVSVESGTAWVQSKVGDEDLIVVGSGKSLRIEPRGSVALGDLSDPGSPRWLSLF